MTGCGMDGSNAGALCPPVVPYSAADQARAAAEVTTLPEGRGRDPDAERLTPSCAIRRGRAGEDRVGPLPAANAGCFKPTVTPGPFHGFTVSKNGSAALCGYNGM